MLDEQLDWRLDDLIGQAADLVSPPEPAVVCRRGRRRRRRAVFLVIAVPLLAVAVVLVARDRPIQPVRPVSGAPAATTSPDQGQTRAPGRPVVVSGQLLGGGRWSSLSARGRPLVVNVTASWCGPCRSYQPVLNHLASTYQPRGVRFVALDTMDAIAAAREFRQQASIAYPVLSDSAGSLVRRLGVDAVPVTLVLDRDGRLVVWLRGDHVQQPLTAVLDTLTAQHP
jgi:thiol-disulfide isomerase/thioredoxin